jgi:hypothetical protein
MIPKAMVQAFAALVFLLFVFVTALILGGCQQPATPSLPGDEDVESVVRFIQGGGLRYAQDRATGHCFAVAFIVRDGAIDSRANVGGAVITWVPCS